MFYDRFKQLCIDRGMKPTPTAEAMGITRGTISQWKKGSMPSAKSLQKMSEYFLLPIDEILGTKKEPATEGDRLKDEIMRIFDQLPPEEQEKTRDFALFLLNNNK